MRYPKTATIAFLSALALLIIGLSGCVPKAEPDADSSWNLDECEPGETKQVDCNTCTCTADEGWACTEIACDGSGADAGGDDASSDAGASCQDGETKQVDCNTCTCSNGTWACTQMECNDAGADYDPCSGKTCGERCTVCPPNDPTCSETTVVKYCQPDGSCSSSEPSCADKAECQTDADCVISGCSGQICAAESMASTCEWREEYACYQDHGQCGCNEGTCGWAQTDDLLSCLGE